jgi:ABC-2 type transport system ATP-binding protein
MSDLERVASDIAFLHRGELLINAAHDALKENVARLSVPAAIASQVGHVLPGELSRRVVPGGGLRLLVQRGRADWPSLVQAPGVRLDHLSLEDLFLEVAE